MATISLNANRYVLATDRDGKPMIRERYVPRQSTPYRLIGTVFRENDPSMGHYVFGDFPKGIGWARSNRNTGRGVGGSLFATADIRFSTQTPQLLAETQTHAAPADHPKGRFIDFAGESWGFFESDYAAGGGETIRCRDWNAGTDTWDTPTTGNLLRAVDAAGDGGARVFAVALHKGNLIAVTNDEVAGVGAGSERAFAITRNPNPETTGWTALEAGAGWPANTGLTTTVTRRNNFDEANAAMVDEGNILLVALYFDASGTTDADAIRIYETSDLGV